jgi:hypothetical protein
VTSVMEPIEERQKTIGYVNSDSDSDACGGAISGIGGVENYKCHMHVSGINRPELLF